MKSIDLKAWRNRTGMTQSDLARALGVHTMTVSRWERGTMKPPGFLWLALNWLEQEGAD